MWNSHYRNGERGSAGAWVMGCLAVVVVLTAAAIAVGLYFWNTMAKPFTATASPDDLRYFLDDMPSERRIANFPRMLIVEMDPAESGATLMLEAMPPECEITLMISPDESELLGVMQDFADRHGYAFAYEDESMVALTVDLDESFAPSIQELAASLATYIENDTWTYLWFGKSFVVPEHIEVTSGSGALGGIEIFGLSDAIEADTGDDVVIETEVVVVTP